MDGAYFEDQVFVFESTEPMQLTPGTYEGCHFNHCNLSGTNLSDFRFLECVFNHCNLDRVELINTSFSEVKFADCK